MAAGPKKQKWVQWGATLAVVTTKPSTTSLHNVKHTEGKRICRPRKNRGQPCQHPNWGMLCIYLSHSHLCCRYIAIQHPLISILQVWEMPSHCQDLQQSTTSINLRMLQVLTLQMMMSTLAPKHACKKYTFIHFVELFSPASLRSIPSCNPQQQHVP